MLDDVSAFGPPWSTATIVAVVLVMLLPVLLTANQALRAPNGRCAAALRRARSIVPRFHVRWRTLLEVSLVVAACLAAVMLGVPLMNHFALRQVSASGDLVQLYHKPVGPYEVTVLVDRKPIQVGVVNFSVIVERPAGEILRDVRVVLIARPIDDVGTNESFQATADGARSQFAYSAPLQLGQPGRWRINMQITGPEGGGVVSFEVVVAPPPIYEQPVVQAGVGGAALAPVAWWGWRRFSRHAADQSARQ